MAMRRIALTTLGSALAGLPAGVATDELERTYQAFRDSRPGVDTRASAQAQAYQWLSGGRFAEALALFQLNAASHPDDPGSQFHLGEAFRYTGQGPLAVEQYQRTLEIDPDFAQARARLELVQGN